MEISIPMTDTSGGVNGIDGIFLKGEVADFN